jgi:hypothetical protein
MNLTGFNFDSSSSSSELNFGHADVYYLKKNIRAENNSIKLPQPTVSPIIHISVLDFSNYLKPGQL